MHRNHLLIIRFSALGDVTMMVPIVWALAQQYPDLRITVLSRPMMRPLFDDLAPNVNFMAADVKQEYHGVKGLNALYRRLVAKQFTHIADMHAVLRSEYLRMRFNMGHYRVAHIDKHRLQRRKLVASGQHKRLRQMPTSFQNYLDVLAHLGFPVDTETHHFTSIFPPEGGNLNMLPKIIGPKLQWEQWIGVAPFSAHRGKVYPPERMRQVILQLSDRYPKARIFLFGRGRQEEETFQRWVNIMPQCVCVSQHLESIFQELILMSHLDVMLSMDSANQHLASLTGTPVVSVWGATHPYAGFMGWNQPAENAVQISLPCRPCSVYGNKPCLRGDYACMEGISTEMIFEKINSILTSKNLSEQ
ncbi:MAG: glycosyltransferase family 9 protein [Prevotella sp.]|nr:glycosyltransferase family 9 protein [Prevotella sp.]